MIDDLTPALDRLVGSTDAIQSAVGYVVDADGATRCASIGVPTNATFRIASSTKTFTADAVLRLAEQGELSLDDPVIGHLPVDRTAELDLAGISIRHLLGHTSGLPDMDGEWFMNELFVNPSRQWSPWEKIELSVNGATPRGPIGSPARYCDVGYILLAMLIEHVTHRPLASNFRTLLKFDELNLPTIHLELLEPVPSSAGPRVRHRVGETDVTDVHASCDLWGAGGLVSDARDLAEWWRALFGGRIFDDKRTLDQMLTVTPEPSANRDMGLGLYRRAIAGHDIWAHGGYWGSYPVHDSTTGVTAVLMLDQCLDEAGPGLGFAVAEVLGMFA